MIRRFALFSIALAGAVALGTLAASAYPSGDPLDTNYTFHVPVQLTDINADKVRTPVDRVEVICAVSEGTTPRFPPRDAATGMPTGRAPDPEASKMLALPANSSLNQTVEIVVKGTAYERSYACGLRFYLRGSPAAFAPSELNKPTPHSGTGLGGGSAKGPPGSNGDLGHPYDDATFKELVSGLIN